MKKKNRNIVFLGLIVGLLTAGCAAISDLFTPSGLAIQKFAVSPKEVTAGGTATLSWDVDGADSIQIDNGIGIVKSKGTAEIRIDRTTTYTISARGGSATATSSVQILVSGTAASPTPAPTATPTPSPTPAPSPTPTPTPAPSPSPSAGASCRLPAMRECGAAEGPKGVYGCCREERAQVFAENVEAAIERIQRERPELFTGDRPKDADAYVQGVAAILVRDFGLCAKQGGPEDEVAVKNSNGFSEQFDILFGNGRIRNSGYTVTCRPARF